MASKPNYRVTRTDGETGKTTTVGRHVTGEAAAQSRLERRALEAAGDSTSFGVREIKHRERA